MLIDINGHVVVEDNDVIMLTKKGVEIVSNSNESLEIVQRVGHIKGTEITYE